MLPPDGGAGRRSLLCASGPESVPDQMHDDARPQVALGLDVNMRDNPVQSPWLTIAGFFILFRAR